MKIAFACDQACYPIKNILLEVVHNAGHEIMDLGTHSIDPVDYPDYAEKIARVLQTGQAQRGILICGSGVGACIAANKLTGIYAGVCHDTYSAHQGVEHDDMNVLCLGARILGVEPAKEIVAAFLGAEFNGDERHVRRVQKVRKLEANKSAR